MPYELLRTIKGPHDLKQLSVEQLPQLADEIRRCICDQISRTGGHFASNLCVVELTLALHYVFDFSFDRLLWDVGHQCYPHKLITGRLDLFSKLKARGGMAGFPDPKESEYDLYSVGHAGASISCAVGMARGDDAMGQGDRRSVALIGDASIVNGLAMEGLNNAGTLNRQCLVVLNDNGMAIAPSQGAMAAYFDRVRVSPTFADIKRRGKEILDRIPGGSYLEEMYHRSSDVLKAAICTEHMFEHFGLVCIGPIDGHDLPMLVEMFNELRDINRPVLMHCKTVKGKGFEMAEGNPYRFHAIKPSVIAQSLPDGLEVSDCKVVKKNKGHSFTNAFADALGDLMGRDPQIHALTAAMPDGTGLDKLIPRFPDRVIDVGLCEGHGMAMASGMAKAGLKPFYAVYSTFSQRALDQTFQEVALQNLPVRVCLDRSGYVGGDGAPMHGFMDIAMNRCFPFAAILAAADGPTMQAGLEFMYHYEQSVSFIRYPRDNIALEPIQDPAPPFELGKANRLIAAPTAHPDLAILALGPMVYHAWEAMKQLKTQGYSISLYDARFAKPVDVDLVQELIEADIAVITIEEHTLCGGFGAAVLEAANEKKIDTRSIGRIGMPDHWVHHDSRSGQLIETGLDAEGIARQIRHFLDDDGRSSLESRADTVGMPLGKQ